MTTLAPPTPTCLTGPGDRKTAARRFLTPGAFPVIAVEVFLFSCLVSVYLVFRDTYPEVQRSSLRFTHWGWGAAQILLVALGLAIAATLARLGRKARGPSVMVLAALATICGLIALGLKAMEWARWGGPHVITVKTQAPTPPPGGTSPRHALPVKPDPKLGAKAYIATCVACHGPAGEGVAQVGPSLKSSEFVAQSTDAQVAALIANGRLPTDPANKTKKLMPGRGGNPFLSDGEIASITAYLRQMAGGSAPAEVAVGGPVLPRWVVPLPPAGPAGLSPTFNRDTAPAPIPAEFLAKAPTRNERCFAPVAAAFGVFQGLLMLIAIAISVLLLWQGQASRRLGDLEGLARFACFHWAVALVIWLAIFPLLYVV